MRNVLPNAGNCSNEIDTKVYTAFEPILLKERGAFYEELQEHGKYRPDYPPHCRCRFVQPSFCCEQQLEILRNSWHHSSTYVCSWCLSIVHAFQNRYAKKEIRNWCMPLFIYEM